VLWTETGPHFSINTEDGVLLYRRINIPADNKDYLKDRDVIKEKLVKDAAEVGMGIPVQRSYGEAEPESGEISGYQLKDPSEVPQPEFKKAALPKQLSLDFKAPGVSVSKTVPPAQRTRMVSTRNISASGNVVRNADDAATLLDHIRKSA
jgi:hypothetical protein